MVAPFPLTNAALAEVEFNKIDFIQLPFIPKYLLIIKVSLDWKVYVFPGVKNKESTCN